MWINTGEIPNNGKDDDDNGYIDDVHGYDFISDDGDPRPNFSFEEHGTHCAGIIGATYNNHIGITGVVGNTNEKVKIMAIRQIGCAGCSSDSPPSQRAQAFTTLSSKLLSLDYAVNNGAVISSNSYGFNTTEYPGSKAEWRSAIKALNKFLDDNPDHLYVGAAGNDGAKITKQRPQLHTMNKRPNQLIVGASDKDDKMASFSNWGKPYVHVMAPGSHILSTTPDYTFYRFKGGTSQAAPHVAGLAALVRSMDEDNELSASDVKDLIVKHVRKKKQYRNKVKSGGLICFASTIRAAAKKLLKHQSKNPSAPSSCD